MPSYLIAALLAVCWLAPEPLPALTRLAAPAPAPAAPSPPAQRDRDLTVTLTGLTSGVAGTLPPRPAPRGEIPWLLATFRLAQGGTPTNAWVPATVVLADPRGHAWRPVVISFPGYPDLRHVFMRQTEPLADEAWKMRVEFIRPLELVARELLTAHAIPLPRGEERLELQDGPQPQSELVRLLAITDNELLVRFQAPRADTRLQARGADDQGRTVIPTESSARRAAGATEVRFRLNLLAGARSLDLTFIPAEAREVTFDVRIPE